MNPEDHYKNLLAEALGESKVEEAEPEAPASELPRSLNPNGDVTPLPAADVESLEKKPDPVDPKIIMPEWDGRGSAFDIRRGKHESLIEGYHINENESPVEALKKTRFPLILTIVVVAANLLAFGAGIFIPMTSNQAPVQKPVNTASQKLDPVLNWDAAPKSRDLMSRMGVAGPEDPRSVEVVVSGNKFSDSLNNKLWVAGSIEPSAEKCKVYEVEDFCLAGTAIVDGFSLPNRVLVFITPAGSGWAVVTPKDFPTESAEALPTKIQAN